MPAFIRPNRPEVSRAFPIAGFTIRTGISPSWVEVAFATDPTLLFGGEDANAKRTAKNFWSSRANDLLPVERGEVVYLIPPKIMSRFVGNPRLYYALAVYRERSWNNPEVVRIPIEAVPYITITPSFTGRSRGLMDIVSNRQGLTGTNNQYINDSDSPLEWGGDHVLPGEMTSVSTPPNGTGAPATSPQSSNGNGNGNGAQMPANGNGNGAQTPISTEQGFAYDDGFNPDLWSSSQQQQPVYSGMEQITQTSMGLSYPYSNQRGSTMSHADDTNQPSHAMGERPYNATASSRAYMADPDYENYGIEAPIPNDASTTQVSSRAYMADSDYENYGIEAPIPDDPSAAMDYQPRQLEDESLGGQMVGKIGEAVIKRIVGSTDGDIKWELDRLNGLIYPFDDKNNAGTRSYTTHQTKVSGMWIENLYTDRITADFEIRWQSNGRSIGNIDVRNINTNDAVGWGLEVSGHIVKDANSYRPTDDPNGEAFAAVNIVFTYRFTRTIGSDRIAVIRYKLYGNGTHHRSSKWTQ